MAELREERPNASLTAEEKAAKKARKWVLKQQHREARAKRRAANTEAWAAGCSLSGTAAHAAAGEAGSGEALVPLKDDMGRVYASAPAEIVAAARERIRSFMQSFLDEPAFVRERESNTAKGLALLDKMKKGQQTSADFADVGALWAYAKFKWPARSLLVFEAFRQAHGSGFLAPAVARLASADCTVASVGGGPGNDLFGFELCRELILGGPAPTAPAGSGSGSGSGRAACQRIVFDFAAEWAPLVEKAGSLSGPRTEWRGCDLSAPLEDAANDALRGFASDADVVLLSYVLQEVGTLFCWRQCVRALWRQARAGCVFYVKDPNDRTARQVLELLGGAGEEGPAGGRLRQSVDWCWCCGDALLLLKPAAALETPAAGVSEAK